MNIYVGITDKDWFDFLSQRQDIDEVNFWQPGGNRQFHTLQVGEPFLFKLHAPNNFIVGGGFFRHSSLLPISIAWNAFEEKNGVATLEDMRHRLAKYRRVNENPREDYSIGCIILGDLFYLEQKDWIPVPKDFSLNIVQGKTYDSESSPMREIWMRIKGSLNNKKQLIAAETIDIKQPEIHEITGKIYGDPRLVKMRLGQGTFRVMILDLYDRKCAMTAEKVVPVLEAAHIRPVAREGDHRLDNGLCLRSDFHSLFDQGYVTVTPDYEIRVSNKLREEFHNGEYYFSYDHKKIRLPVQENYRPNKELLEWHSSERFKR